MGFFSRIFSRKKTNARAFLVVQAVAKHRAWYPAHNRGREAPAAAIENWAEKLTCLSERELILMITDNHARNRLLGKIWPPASEERSD